MTTSPHRPVVARLLPLVIALAAFLMAGIALLVAVQDSDDPGPGNDIASGPTPSPTPVPNGAMWSLGTGGTEGNPYYEWVAVHPTSTLWNYLGAPSLRFTNHSPDMPEDVNRQFEIGWYKYGPTWHTRNFIVEFWIGDGQGGALSVAGNDNGGGELEVRNPGDTDNISVNYQNADHPQITVGNNPLYLAAKEGLYSEADHTFLAGINIPAASDHSGQVVAGDWGDGAITIATTAVTADSLVIITPISAPGGQWWVDVLAPGESFTVRSTAADETMDFNWLIIN